MTTIVSDTSPINYLCLIEEIEVLPRLFSTVIIPPAVLKELRHPRAPKLVSEWVANTPSWVTIQSPLTIQPDLDLDPGETEAISLALELGLPAILIDEMAGRRVAESHGIAPIGTLNILFTGDLHGLLDFEASINRLQRTNFHGDAALIAALLAQARARKSGGS